MCAGIIWLWRARGGARRRIDVGLAKIVAAATIG
jgi:hypothetical protein